MCLMLFDGEMPTAQHDKEIVQLTSKHVPDMMELTELVSPGPFGPRTCELGEYIGVFEGERLVSMAGERLWAPPYREISAVCTHPDYQGKGLARRLMEELISRQLKRGEVPTLHVISSNQRAYDLYTRLGYKRYKEYAVRLITRVS